MDVGALCCVLGVAAIILTNVWRVLNWLWLEPKKKEKFLRDQGLNGTSYTFMFGDLKETAQMTTEAKAKPMSFTHDIAPRVSPFFYNSVTTYGKICFTWMGPNPLVHVGDPTMIREILSDYRRFQKPRGGNPLIKLLGGGIIDTEGEEWVKPRKIINPAFHAEKLKHMIPAYYKSCSEMIHRWGEMLNEENFCEVDVWPHCQMFSSDVISRTAFGSSFEEGRNIFQLQKELTKLVMVAAQSIYIPGSRFLPTKSNKRMKEIDREMKASIRSIINKRLVLMEAEETSHCDLLGILLNSNDDEVKEHGKNNFGLSIEQVIEECKLFYLAGQETTGNLLGWTMILLSKHMDWQARARDEVLHVFGNGKPDINGLNHLKIINMILNEVLRLYPPGVILRRLIHEETNLGNLTLPAQTLIQINTLFMHHDNDIWGGDANEFKPERFSEGVSKVTKGQASYLPFGGGPRFCMGQNFAMLEVKTALVMILQCFSFELSPSYTHAPHTILTLEPEFGAHVILHKL